MDVHGFGHNRTDILHLRDKRGIHAIAVFFKQHHVDINHRPTGHSVHTDSEIGQDVVYNGKEEHLAVSSRYSIVDLPFMLGVDEPADKVCVCRKVRIVNDYVSVALYAGEEIEIQSLSNYL